MPVDVGRDPIIDDAEYLRTLDWRLERAELKPHTVSADERASVLREARRAIRLFSQRQNEGDRT